MICLEVVGKKRMSEFCTFSELVKNHPFSKSGTIVADGICSTSREKLKVGKGHMRMKQKEGI